MRTPVRLVLLVVLTLSVAACGGSKQVCVEHGIKCENLPRHKVYRVNWVERARIGASEIATFRVRRIEVGRNGWKITASFTNDSPRAFRFPTGGRESPKDFGLGVFISRFSPRVEAVGNYLLDARQVTPAFPKRLGPGESWTGTMASDVPPRSTRWLRVLFGVFFWEGKPPYAGLGPFFVWQTAHAVQAPPPLGPGAAG